MRFPRFVLLYVVLTLSTLRLLAQSPDGNINGLVSDPSSAAVVGAEVVAVNDVTGVQYTTKTNNEGIYVLPNLPPGPYRLQVSKVGFTTLIKPDIVLSVQDALSINFTLPIGAAYEVLTVEGGAPLVNTESAAVSTVIDQAYVENMPLNGRSFQDLILLTPGTVTQTPQNSQAALGQTGEFSVNGQRPESNYYSVDGVSANVGAAPGLGMVLGAGASGSLAAATALGTTQALVSVDDLQEFRVQSSTYSAEYGRNPGGQFAFETKSGTNQWHGTAFDYVRNGAFDSQDWFNDYFGTPEPALRQNDFGGTLGGPVKLPGVYDGKDRTFLFLSYEGLRLTQPQAASINYVPDFGLRTSAPAALRPALNAFPVQSAKGIDDVANGIAQFIGTWSNPSSLDSTSVRFDHVLTGKLRIFFRFGDTVSNSSVRPAGFVASDQTLDSTFRTYTAGVSSIISNRLSNEFRLNYSSNTTQQNKVIDAFGGNAPINLAQASGLPLGSFDVVGLIYNGYFVDLLQQENSGAQKQWNVTDAVSLSLGRHQLKFGVDHRRLAPSAFFSSPEADWLYLSEAAVQSNNALTLVGAEAAFYPLYKNFSLFAQDSWRLSQRLNLSLGLRWEVNPAPGVTRGLNAYAIEGSGPATWSLAPQGTPLWKTTWFNFAPRFGAVYAIQSTSGWETVLRGGGGVFFDTGQQLGSLGFSNGPGFDSSANLEGSFPLLPAGGIPVIVNPPVPPYFQVTGFATHLQLPYTLQWNASIEQALGKSQALTASYVGSHASRLLQENLFLPSNNPNGGTFYFVENGLTSDYDSMQVEFRRRLSGGLTTLASYTWSHCIDYGSQDYVLGYQRGNCDFDLRHNLSAAVSYDLPNLRGRAFVRAFLNRWGLDGRLIARTAFPVTLSGNQLLQPNDQVYFGGLVFVEGQSVYLYGSNCDSVLRGLGDLEPGQGCPGGRAINPLAFAPASAGLGDVPRNFARGFDAVQMNLAIRRDFAIREAMKVQFRAEAFNILNHPNFGTVNPTFGENTFGQSTATLANSLGVLSPLYQMGGARSLQLSLKLIF